MIQNSHTSLSTVYGPAGESGCRLVRDKPEKWWPIGLPKGPCRLCKKLACTLGLRAPCVSQNCSAAAAWGLKPGRLNPAPWVIHPAITCSLACTMTHAVVHLISSAILTRWRCGCDTSLCVQWRAHKLLQVQTDLTRMQSIM